MNTLCLRGGARRVVVLVLTLAAISVVPLASACGAGHPVGAAPSPSASSTSGAPQARPLAGLSGWLYYVQYVQQPDRVVRLTSSGLVSVLDAGGWNANVSPDGRSIAFIDGGSNVLVADRDGRHPRTVMRGSVDVGFEPAWSPDSTRLLVVRARPHVTVPGLVDVRTGVFTRLPHNPQGIHYLWSADGRHLGYATGRCRIGVAGPDGANARLTPVLGESDPAVNPDRRRSCDPYSISPDGSRMAVVLRTGDMPDGDIGRDLAANAVIDTRTGATVRLPVTGRVSAVLFQPDGGMLVRSSSGGRKLLTLVSPDGAVTTQVTEPPSVKDLQLLAYTAVP